MSDPSELWICSLPCCSVRPWLPILLGSPHTCGPSYTVQAKPATAQCPGAAGNPHRGSPPGIGETAFTMKFLSLPLKAQPAFLASFSLNWPQVCTLPYTPLPLHTSPPPVWSPGVSLWPTASRPVYSFECSVSSHGPRVGFSAFIKGYLAPGPTAS